MSTPTEKNTDELSETKSETRRVELAVDLARLEAVLAGLEHELWAPRLPPAKQLPRVPGLLRPTGRFADDVPPPPAWLKPERVTLPPEMTLDRNRVGWPLAALIAALCALPLGYFYFAVVGSTPPGPASPPQLASAAMKPVTPPASAPPSLPVLARDDAAEPYEAGDTPSTATVPRAVVVPARETVAMLTSDDRPIAAPAPAPKPPIRALDAEMIALLMQQGEQLADAGDFAAARTLFQRAAEAGDAAAAVALGATYDSVVLARMGAAGIDADIVKARFWYEMAMRLGSSEARRRLELLANR
jgi:hypothetical protein